MSVSQPPQWVTLDPAGLDWKPALHPIVIYPPSNVGASYAKRIIWRLLDEGLGVLKPWLGGMWIRVYRQLAHGLLLIG